MYQHRVVQFAFWRVALICGCVAPVCVTCGVHTLHVWMLCVPWGPFGVCICVALAAEVPGLLLSSYSGWGRRWGSLQWILSSALVSPLIPVNGPGKSAGSSHQWLHGSVERGVCASGAFLLVCRTEVMDKPGGCIFLDDKLNLPLVIAWNMTSGKLDKLSSCAAACVSPKVTSSEGCSAGVQCKAMEQHPTCVGFLLRKKKREKAQLIPDGQPKQFAAFSLALTNYPLQEK